MVTRTAQIFGFVLFIMAQAATLVIYPVYLVLFNAVANTKFELPVLFLLPIIKLIMKNVIAESIGYMEDMLPESVLLTVDFFNAVYMATCMQQISSTTTVITIVTVDIIRTTLTIQSIYGTASNLHRQVNREMRWGDKKLKILQVGCAKCENVDNIARQDLSKIQLRSCLPHKLSSAGKAELARLEKFPFKPAGKIHLRRLSSLATLSIHNVDATTAYLNERSLSLRRVSFRRTSAKVLAGAQMNTIPVRPSQQRSVSRRSSINSLHPRNSSHILHITLTILFRSECLVLTEYLGSFVPICYAAFVCVMIRLPSVQYHKELDGITPVTVQHTVQSVFTYGALEIVSFLALLAVIQRTIGLRALHHLAFVLETQASLVQSKLTVWMLLTLTFRVAHYGMFAKLINRS
ncbi:unnamed protein product [Phytophthora fragariaefolia]|uniref:Unnamed protein product n=1 Tax=Phytophthora fragariaefolia TaxID=1490495 RepID=A0A9W7D836_9STRA|nr:unnamed protein product [Phytophthora fragariaefolia]